MRGESTEQTKQASDKSRQHALETEVFNEIFHVPASGKPVVPYYALDQSRQLFDFNPQAQADRAIREGRMGEPSPIYPHYVGKS